MRPAGAARALPIWSAYLTIVFGACNGDAAAPTAPAEPDTVVSSIEVDPPERIIGIFGTQVWVRAAALTEGGEMLYGSYQSPGRFSWSSSAPDVATVNAGRHPYTGREIHLIRGVGEGTAVITATSQQVTGSMMVTVRDRARLAWSVPTGSGTIQADIAIGADGTIHVATSDVSSSSSRLLALSPQGGVLWTLDLPLTRGATPAIGADGTLYLGFWFAGAGNDAGRLIAVGPGGTVRWVLEGINGIRSSPALGPDGTIYVAGERHVYAVDPQGRVQWAYPGKFAFSSPAVASDGTIYVGGSDGLLHAIRPDGSLRWTFQAGDQIQSSPTIGMDGTIYFGSYDGRLYAVGPDGAKRWSVPLDTHLPFTQPIFASPSIGADGTIYVGASGVFAVDPGGSVRWSYYQGGTVVTTPILSADGTAYVTSIAQGPGGHAIYALDAQGDLLWDFRTGADIMGSPAIGLDGSIILTSFSGSSASYEGAVYAIVETASTNGGYAGAPWPTARGNRANTGLAGR